MHAVPPPTVHAAPPGASRPPTAEAARHTRAPRLVLASPEAEARRLRAARGMLERLGARLAACAPREAAPTSARHMAVAGPSPDGVTLRRPSSPGATP